MALLDNYNPSVGNAENVLDTELAENTAFLDLVLSTEVMALAQAYLITEGTRGERSRCVMTS